MLSTLGGVIMAGFSSPSCMLWVRFSIFTLLLVRQLMVLYRATFTNFLVWKEGIVANLFRCFRRFIGKCAIVAIYGNEVSVNVGDSNYYVNVSFSAESLCRSTCQVTDRSRIVLRTRFNYVLCLNQTASRWLTNDNKYR